MNDTLGPYKVHPAADAFPLMDGDEFEALVVDVAEHGLREPIALTSDGETLVDGRNRYRACVKAGVDPMVHRLDELYQGAKLIDYIVSINVKRRHLNAGQLGFVALALEPIYAGLAKERQREHGKTAPGKPKETLVADLPQVTTSKARDQAAKAVGGSGRGVSKAKKVKKVAPDLADKVMSGQLSLDAAYSKAQAVERDLRKMEPAPAKPKATDNQLMLMAYDGDLVPYAAPDEPIFTKTPGDGISWAHFSWNPVTGCLRDCGMTGGEGEFLLLCQEHGD